MINETPWANDEQLAFYGMLGWALSQWAHVETELSQLFCSLTKGNNFTVRAAFYSIISFEGKLNALNGAALSRFHNVDHLPEWDKLHSKIKKQAKTRNNLAHYSVVIGVPRNNPAANIFLSPSFDNAKSFVSQSGKSPAQYSINEIRQSGLNFADLVFDIEKFRLSLEKTKQP